MRLANRSPSAARVSLSTLVLTQSETERLYHETTKSLRTGESDDEVRLVCHDLIDAERFSRAFEEVIGFVQ